MVQYFLRSGVLLREGHQELDCYQSEATITYGGSYRHGAEVKLVVELTRSDNHLQMKVPYERGTLTYELDLVNKTGSYLLSCPYDIGVVNIVN